MTSRDAWFVAAKLFEFGTLGRLIHMTYVPPLNPDKPLPLWACVSV